MIEAIFAGDALDLIPVGVYVVDARGVLQHYNRRAAELWGREPLAGDPRERYCGSQRMYRGDGTVLKHEDCPVAHVLRDGRARSDQEVLVERPDGSTITVSVNVGPLFDRNGKLIGAVNCFQDVSERKRFEEDLLRAKEAAEDANTAKDQFLAALSHELRTPLAPVLMAAAALETEASLPPHVREDLSLIRRNIELEARLIDDLLDLTRVARGKLELHCEAVDAHAVIRDALQTCCGSDINNKRLTVAMNLRAKSHHVWADSARLAQVFWNLIRNSVKFTPACGRIEVRTVDHSQDKLRVEVIDNGIGIEPELLGRLFDAFEQGGRTTTRRFGGLGLGLAISKALIEMHGGQIVAHSEGSGKGAVFSVTLPLIPTPHGHRLSLTHPASVRRRLRILLVEDHEMTARVLERLLRGLDYQVATAGSVEHALSAASSSSFDLLISDLGLPDGSGLDLMRQLREMYQLKGIALSGYGMEDDIRRSREVGFAAHLTKPVSLEKLQATISQIA